MAKSGSSEFSVLLAGGYDLLGAEVQNATHRVESITQPSHGLGSGWEKVTPVGMRRATLAQDGGFFDDQAHGTHEAFKASTGLSRIFCVAFARNAIGRPFLGAAGMCTVTYEVIAQLAQLTRANATYAVSGAVDRGTILQHHVQKSADWNTKTDDAVVDYALDPSQQVIPITSNSQAAVTVVTTPIPHRLTTGQVIVISDVEDSSPTINGERTVTVISPTTFSVPVNTGSGSAGTGGSFVRASTPAGGVGYLQVSELAGITGCVVKIRDSADDTTYADLVTFADVTAAPAAERIEVAGTVDRYLSVDGNITGTGTVTPFVAFARN